MDTEVNKVINTRMKDHYILLLQLKYYGIKYIALD